MFDPSPGRTGGFYLALLRLGQNGADAVHTLKAAGLEPITPHEARHCAISYFIAAGLDWKQISTWAGHGDVRQTWNRYGHLVPGGEDQARERLDAYLNPPKPTPTVAHTVAQDPQERENPSRGLGFPQYRYRDSNCPSGSPLRTSQDRSARKHWGSGPWPHRSGTLRNAHRAAKLVRD